MVGAYEIPQGVTSVGDYAFWGCDGLEFVTIPEGVTSIGDWAFASCDSLLAINVNEDNVNYSSVGGVLFNKDQTVLIDCPDGMVGAYEIPQGVISIGDWAFYWCNRLTSVTIPEGVTSIGFYSFGYCGSLESITIPASVTTIENYAFYFCDSFSTIRYTGTAEQWSGIAVGSDNDDLLEAQMIFKDASAASAELVDEYTSDTGNANEDAASLWELSVARGSETVSSVGVDVTVGGNTQTKTIDTANVEGDLIFGIVVNKHQADISYIDAAVNGTSKYNVYTAE